MDMIRYSSRQLIIDLTTEQTFKKEKQIQICQSRISTYGDKIKWLINSSLKTDATPSMNYIFELTK